MFKTKADLIDQTVRYITDAEKFIASYKPLEVELFQFWNSQSVGSFGAFIARLHTLDYASLLKAHEEATALFESIVQKSLEITDAL